MKNNVINVGDRVRFLNNVGGGMVTRIDRSKFLVYVEDEDGFEVPVLERECVVVPEVNPTTNFPKPNIHQMSEDEVIVDESRVQKGSFSSQFEDVQPEFEVVETPEGDDLNAMIAFIPQKIKEIHSTDFDLVLINDSNYFLLYNIMTTVEGKVKSIASGRIEPNIQEDIIRFDNRKLEEFSRISVQLIAFKHNKSFEKQQVIDAFVKFDPIKFLKLHTYTVNDYFDEPALIFGLK